MAEALSDDDTRDSIDSVKHIIGLAARYKLCSISLEAKNITLGQKKKKRPHC